MAAALRTAAQSQNLIETREGVGKWVRRAMGDELARRHRLIDTMFSAAGPSPALSMGGSGASVITSSEPLRSAGPAPTPHMSRAVGEPSRTPARTPAQGQKARQPEPRLGRRTRRGPTLTDRQQTIVALASVLAFAVTVTIGFAVSRRPAGRGGNREATAAFHGQASASRVNLAD
jgi:hypothetical protein